MQPNSGVFQQLHMFRKSIIYAVHQIRWLYLDRRRRYAPKMEFEKTPPSSGILFPVSNLTLALLRGP